ncbi:MAG: ABC transporter permease [Thermoplasmataceae archaeon]
MRTMKNKIKTLLYMLHINGNIYLLRNKFALPAVTLSPLSFIFFIYIFGGVKAIQYGAMGGLIYIIVNSTFFALSDIASYKTNNLFQDMIIASPIPLWAYLIGIGLGDIVYVIPAIAVFMILLVYITSISLFQILLIIVVLLMLWVFLLSICYHIAQKIEKNKDIWPILSLLSVVLSIFPPIFYPYTILPFNLQMLALLAPTTSAAYTIHGIIYGFSFISVVGMIITFFLFVSGIVIIYFASFKIYRLKK